jgi:hypothetical protein
LANVPAKQFTYVVGDAEEGLITSQRSAVQPADMERQRSLRDIRGEPRTFIEREYADTSIA